VKKFSCQIIITSQILSKSIEPGSQWVPCVETLDQTVLEFKGWLMVRVTELGCKEISLEYFSSPRGVTLLGQHRKMPRESCIELASHQREYQNVLLVTLWYRNKNLALLPMSHLTPPFIRRNGM